MEKLIGQAGVILNDYVKSWKDKGGRVVGYVCTATPTEVLEAAGVMPYRIRALGKADTEIADAHLSRFNCSFCRSCLQLGLDGTYDFLDGLIETNGCDHIRGMVENWNYQNKFDFFHYLKVPHIVDTDSRAYFIEELRLYRKAVGDYFDADITDDLLREKILQQQRIRDRMRTVYHMREREKPAFTGAEALALFLLATAVPAGEADNLLGQAIEMRKDHAVEGYRARLLLGGAATDEAGFVKAIEEVGGLVVADALCFGARAFLPPCADPAAEDPIESLSRTYFENLLCPRMFDDFSSRRRFVLEAVERADVHGVVLVHNKFCDVHGVDNVQLRMALEDKGVPVLQIEKEYGAKADTGRIKTRVQAFLERIGK